MNIKRKRNVLICILLTVILFMVFIFSNAAYIINGDSIKDDNRLLYMYRSDYRENDRNNAILIKSYDALKNYYYANNEKFDLDTDNPNAKYYELKSFRDIVFDTYDYAFFQKKHLILLVTYEQNDESYYRLNSFDYWFTKANVGLYRDTPNENAKGEKVCWHTFLEVEKKNFVYSATVKVEDK